jgi:hypothetical protein
MFINQIDEIINNIIDLVYKKKINTDVLIKNKSLLDIIDKKMYKNINNLLGVRYSNNIINIIETIILYLIILLPGIKQKDFTKYIIELSKKNINLLDPETISKIIKIYNVYTDIKLKKNKDLINDIDEFFLKNKESEFNLIKIIIVNYVYLGEYRHHILELIENKELENTESKIIEIIDSKEDEIDYNNLEMLFDINEKYLSEIFYQMIVDYENNIFEDNLSSEQKINKLFNKRILIPITDEFIRYNKYTDKIKNTNVKLDNIRKVITNINTVVDIYSKKDIDHNKIFYQQLLCKKAILYNNVEEIISINKLLNIGLSATRSNEYFQDLLIYREYSYINFNNFKNYGFSFLPCHSINAIRYSNFEFKKINMNNFLETRVLTINNRVNVVGVALPKNNLFNTNSVLQCTIIKNTYDLDNIKNNKYEVILKLIKQMLLNNINYKKLPYWIFDKNKDVFITDTYNDINELTFEEFYKYMIASIYDIVIDITYQKIINNVNKCTTLQSCYNISDYVQNKLINLSNNYIYNSNLEKVFIETTKIKKKIKYDKNEDIIPGITTDLIKLPKYKYNKHKLINIYISNNNDNNNNDNYDDNNKYSTCQHNISWEKMYIHKKKNPNYFNQLLFEFKKKYITVNLEGNFVCKSCYQPVNIKKYAFDWTTETEEGIGLSFTLETQLKDLSEYEKYNKIILQLDKYIERIATGVNLPIYIGNIPQIKIRRQGIVKNIIDFINIQNKTLRINDSNERKKRLEKVEKLFGIKKTQFFIFELENDIFLYSSKEVDKYKRSKLNNIYIYAIMFLINEISLNQVLFFIEDKNINIETFKKNYKSLFSDLYIYVNNNKELKPLYNFPLLCYILYIFSGVLIKYNLWYNPTKIKVFDYNLYSSIIHTYVDLLNSILEVNTLKEKNYLYEVYATKFYIQLNKVFNSNKLLINKNINNINEKKQKDNIITTILTGKIIEPQFGFNNFYSRSALKFLLTMTNNKIQINYNDINKSLENWSNDLLYVLYNYYNLDGTKRFIDDVKNENVNKNELFKMLKNIIHRRKILSDNIEKKRLEYNKNINNKLLEYKQYNDNLNKDVKNNKKNIFNLIQNLEKIVNINLSNNQYIIDHDISGNKLKNPIIIMEGDKKIQFKRNDIKYGTNIYIYEDNNNLYVYNAITLNMIAYKNNLNKIINVNLPLYLNINYSLKHQLLFLGHEKIYYNIKDLGAHKKKIINNLIRNRILNLKNIIINIQRILQQIHNKYDNNNININIIAKNYMNKFKNINITLDNSEIKNIINNIYFVPFDYNLTLKEDSEYIYIGSLQIIQNNDNIILDFICNELIKLLNANTNDKYILTNLALIIIDIIKKEYNNYMKRNNSLNNIEVRKFIETKSNLLIFNNKDNMDDFIDVNIQNNDEEDNDEIENGNGYDVDINSEDDENEALFTID